MTDASGVLDPALPRATDAAAFAADPFAMRWCCATATTSYGHYPVDELGLDLLRIEAGRVSPSRRSIACAGSGRSWSATCCAGSTVG